VKKKFENGLFDEVIRRNKVCHFMDHPVGRDRALLYSDVSARLCLAADLPRHWQQGFPGCCSHDLNSLIIIFASSTSILKTVMI